MTDPRRLLDDDSAFPFSRGLLASASDDGLDEERLAELVRAATETAADGASSKPAAPAAPSKGRIVATKPMLLATLALLAAGAFVLSRAEEPVPPVPRAPAVSAREVPAPPAAVAEPTTEAVPVALLPSASNAEAKPIAPATPVTPVTTPASGDSDRLMEEVRALERVSAAIAQHRIADARAGLTTYERTFPKQLLASEARFLEIEILVAEGRHDKAQERARAYLASWPDSPYAARVRSIVPPSRP